MTMIKKKVEGGLYKSRKYTIYAADYGLTSVYYCHIVIKSYDEANEDAILENLQEWIVNGKTTAFNSADDIILRKKELEKDYVYFQSTEDSEAGAKEQAKELIKVIRDA